jgi:hypothetical protein
MDNMREELKAEVATLGPRGRGRPYPKGLLEKVLSYTVARRRQGAKLIEVAVELGLHNHTLSRWLGEKRAAKAANGEGPVLTMRQQKWWADDLRRHLTAAKVKREALFSTDSTRKRLRFHDLRSTGLTWLAIRGDDVLKLQQRAGHSSFEMTQKYIRTAEAVGEVIGNVFPPLPAALLGSFVSTNRPEEAQVSVTIVEAPGIEPGSARLRDNLRSRA